MNAHNADKSCPERCYSPFGALCLLFLLLLFLQGAYVKDDFKQHDQMQAEQSQLKAMMAQAQTLSQTTDAIGRDLLALSTNSAEAAKIIAEFQIQISYPPKPSK